MAQGSDSERRVVDAAVQLFDAKGFVSTTISDISELAGVSRPTFYAHFESKEALIDHIVNDIKRELAGVTTSLEITSSTTAADIAADLRPLMAAVLEVLMERRNESRMLLRNAGLDNPLGKAGEYFNRLVFKTMRRMSLTWQRAQDIEEFDTDFYTLYVYGALKEFVFFGLASKENENYCEDHLDEFLETTFRVSSYPAVAKSSSNA